VQSKILNRHSLVKIGDEVEVRYRTNTGLTPTITVYDPDDEVVLEDTEMEEVEDEPGLYEYTVEFDADWGTGEFHLVCEESTTGTMDSVTMTVFSYNLDSIGGNLAAVLGETQGLADFGDVTDSLSSHFSTLQSALSKMSEGPGGVPREIDEFERPDKEGKFQDSRGP
jgi:hypothetical protein